MYNDKACGSFHSSPIYTDDPLPILSVFFHLM